MSYLNGLRELRNRFLSPLISQADRIEGRLLESLFHLNKIELRLQAIERIQEALGRVEARQMDGVANSNIEDNEFRVFSQWGEDGIIQFLLRHVPIDKKIFVEFGVEDYTESNTRFLLVNCNWTGLVIDQSSDNIRHIKASHIYWHYNLKAVHTFVTRDNINRILEEQGISGEIGLLSIDVDGNDYWIWQAIRAIDPVIVAIEYNHRFGKEAAVTIPYDENFNRARAHHSMIYFGASLKAICGLAKQRGYAFVGCNSNGVSAFFIRRDRKPATIREVSIEEGYVEGKFCEARDANGSLMKISLDEERRILESLPLVNVDEIESEPAQ